MPRPSYREQWVAEVKTIRLGRTRADQLRIAQIFAYAHLRLGRARRLTGWLPERTDNAPTEVTLRSGTKVLVRPGDAIPFFEHFGLDVYGTPLPGEVRTVVDLGANAGFAAIALAQRYPGVSLVCVEPEATTRELLAANLALNGLTAQIFDVAVVGTPGPVSLVVGDHYGISHIERGGASAVEGITLSELLDRASLPEVDLLKIDIEGAEAEVFDDVAAWGSRVRSIIGELHGDLTKQHVLAQLGAAGFVEVPLPVVHSADDLVCVTRPG